MMNQERQTVRGEEMAGWDQLSLRRLDEVLDETIDSWKKSTRMRDLALLCSQKVPGFYSVGVAKDGTIDDVFFGEAEKRFSVSRFRRGMQLQAMEDEGLLEFKAQ